MEPAIKNILLEREKGVVFELQGIGMAKGHSGTDVANLLLGISIKRSQKKGFKYIYSFATNKKTHQMLKINHFARVASTDSK